MIHDPEDQTPLASEDSVYDADPDSDGPASRHYQRARRDRGGETRARLIAAALDAFGRYGFEGTSTRDIAKAAKANLAAIVYHFGSKEALHLAVAEHVVRELELRMGPTQAAIEAAIAAGPPDRIEARALLQQLVERQITTMLDDDEAARWARFIVREQMDPTASFETISAYIDCGHGVATKLLGILLDIDPSSEEAHMRMFALGGQIVLFRVSQPTVLRSLGRAAFDEGDRSMITAVITENIDRIVGVPLAAELRG